METHLIIRLSKLAQRPIRRKPGFWRAVIGLLLASLLALGANSAVAQWGC